ncbi:MAG: NAD(P)H-dependent oxidoreductase subunit E [Clostridiales bacterium]|nr:NAD(P)H-dependent oxidoreductase subunit E [Clostridiales bacterium]
MKKKLTTVQFRGTKEQEEKLHAIIEQYRGLEGAMMPVLQQAQEVYGYLPMEVLKMISEGMDKPLAEVYGVASFYSQFSLNPKGEISIAVCLGTACYVKGSGDILNRITEKLGVASGATSPDGKYSIEATRCIGACGLAPVLTINETVYGRLSVDDVDDILAKYQ